MDKDTIAGTVKEASGKVRSAFAHVTGNKEGEARANADEAQGKMQKNYGKAKEIIKDTVNE